MTASLLQFFTRFIRQLDYQGWIETTVLFFLYTLVWFWGRLTPDTWMFFIGTAISVLLFQFTEQLFNLKISPLRTVLFHILLFIIVLFTISSTQNMLAKGVVIGLLYYLFHLQVFQYIREGDISSWLDPKIKSSLLKQQLYLSASFLSFLFVILFLFH